jgi:hypothetical protein
MSIMATSTPFNLSQLLPQGDDVYRVHWFGACKQADVGRLSTIETFLAPVEGLGETVPFRDGAMRADSKRLQSIQLPIGLLPMLPLGTVVSRTADGLHRQPTNEVVGFTVTPDHEHTDTSIVRANTLRPPKDDTAPESYLGTVPPEAGNAWCAVIAAKPLSEDRRWSKGLIVIPCLELVRFYYGSSSALIRSVLWGEHRSNGRSPENWANPERSGFIDRQGGVFRVCLRRNRPWSDANVVARAHSQRGLAEAERPYRSLAQGTAGVSPSRGAHPAAYLPFDDLATWMVRGHYVKAHVPMPDGKATLPALVFLVNELVSCSGPFPYQHLIVEREGTILSFRVNASADPSDPDHTDAGGNRKSRPLKVRDIAPGLAQPRASRVLFALQSDRFTVLRGRKRDERLDANPRRIVILAPLDDSLPTPQTFGGTSDAGDPGRRAEIQIRDDLAQLDAAQHEFQQLVAKVALHSGCRASLWAEGSLSAHDDGDVLEDGYEELATPDSGSQFGFALPATTINESLQPRSIAWALINGERPRRLFAATFDVEGHLVYLFDVERRPGECFTFLVLGSTSSSVDPALLSHVCRTCVACEGVWLHAMSGFTRAARPFHQQGPTPAARDLLVERLSRIIKDL